MGNQKVKDKWAKYRTTFLRQADGALLEYDDYPLWDDLVLDLCGQIYTFLPEKDRQYFVFIQLKEKFGGLRAYWTWETDDENEWERLNESFSFDLYELVGKYEDASFKICQGCGVEGTTRNELGWTSTLCEKHWIARINRKEPAVPGGIRVYQHDGAYFVRQSDLSEVDREMLEANVDCFVRPESPDEIYAFFVETYFHAMADKRVRSVWEKNYLSRKTERKTDSTEGREDDDTSGL